MARPVDRLPGVRVGQPFYLVRNRGKGLNSHERADLLDVVMTVCPPRLLMDLTDASAATEMICSENLILLFGPVGVSPCICFSLPFAVIFSIALALL